jgi:hypothetical protein
LNRIGNPTLQAKTRQNFSCPSLHNVDLGQKVKGIGASSVYEFEMLFRKRNKTSLRKASLVKPPKVLTLHHS